MRRLTLLLAVLTAAVGVTWFAQPEAADLTVYCAHDAVYAAPFLREFTRATGITVSVRYDTEATKSLGLTELISRERDRPRCDVFWNNEPLGTARLAGEGLLAPYRGTGWARIPAAFKDPEGRWVGFAGRLRVWIVNRDRLAASPAAVDATWRQPGALGAAFAKPLFGTTRFHLTALHEQLGADRMRAFHADLLRRGVQVVSGNSAVKDLVAQGRCAVGWTDTDDYFAAIDRGAPVAMLPVTLPDGATLCVPNTAAIVRSCRNRPAAERLVDYLASAEGELALARSRSRQVPLGPVDNEALPAEVRALVPAARRGYRFRTLAASSAACLQFLKAEYVR